MKLIGTIAGTGLVAIVVASCGGGGGGGNTGSTGGPGGGSAPKFASGGTFTMALTADPGNLDPQMSAASSVGQLAAFSYDSLVSADDEGKIVSQLAKDWKVAGTTVTMTLNDGITCSDGTPFTAADAAANINFMSNPANKSSFLGVYVPAGAKASASGSALTIKLAGPAPFVLEGLSAAPMVCKSGLDNRKLLAKESRGTGPFQLTEVVPSDHLTFTKRAGYTWGPNGATTAEAGLPDKAIVKIVPNNTTAANLLLSGGLNAATVIGQDATRLAGAKLFAANTDAVSAEMWYNHVAGRPGSDPAVRKALTQAVDLKQLQQVITAKQGTPPTTLAAVPPVACKGDSITAALPTGGVEVAKATLDAAGWKAGAGGTRSKDGKELTLAFNYNTAYGPEGAAASELAVAAWKQLGAKVTARGQDATALLQTLFTSGNWDVAWLTLNVSSPDQLVPFFSGPAAPNGNNFSHIDNKTYAAGVAKAMKLPGKEGCTEWLAAETNLVKEADIIPFANLATKTFGKGAQFSSVTRPVTPISIRMLAT